ncbi:Disease resistance protein RGA2, partial [Mucuna pruriens]
MAEALLGFVIENLGSFVRDQLATFWGIDQQTQKLSSNLTTIRDVLKDAERKQITSHAIKNWLQKLTDAAYVLDDILDECSIQSKKLHSDGHNSCLSRVHPKDILFRRHIAKRMEDITQRFHNIHEERLMFELRAGITEMHGKEDDEWRQTSSVITEPIVYGRDQDREQIVKFLLEHTSNTEDLSIYPIVGMAGLGKTTLVKQVFHDVRVSKHFDLTIWVCVSDDFNMKTILQSIIECSTGQNPNLNTLEAKHKRVQELLHSKRYLLVLDDVWNEDQEKWKELKGTLQCARGIKGATVLVTTRIEKVASIMEAHPAHRLIELSEDDSWSLFKHHAFGPNREESSELVAIGKEIVGKCVGSPLAIKTLGSLLHDKSEVKHWQHVKGSEFWDIRDESSITSEENSIMRALKLSYVNLELSSRKCFSFCAIFPKGSEIVKEDLIHLWMANGLIKSEGNLEMEDVGNKAWKKLYHRSFFQEAKCDDFGIITSFKMHDLFHDLAQSIMGEECVVYEHTRLTHLSSRVHHLHLLKSINRAAFTKVESLRTFLGFNSHTLGENFRCLPSKSLRALGANSYQLSSLMDLTHLRYLNLRGSWVTCLSNSICGLQKLQILKLEDCENLYWLPKKLTRLQDLRHLVINRCYSIVEMPPNIGKLSHLNTLSTFIVGSRTGFGLSELHGLKLRGKLHIRGLENVPSELDAKQANLISKKDLNRLYLSWGGSANSQGSNVNAEQILEALEPPSTLKSFGMKGYEGIRLPCWMRNPSVLKDLVEVILYECVNCEELPPLGKLVHLKSLFVSGMNNVKYIDGESYDGVEEKAFPSLEIFTARNLPNLERMLRDEGVEMLPRLSEISICGVPNLKLPHLPAVEHLESSGIEDAASFMEGVVGNMFCLKTLKIEACDKLKALLDQLGRLGALQELAIRHCDELESFPEHALQGLTSLQTLCFSKCKKLKSLSQGVGHLALLEHLNISYCPELVALPSNMSQLTALREVSINCSILPEGLQHIPSLKRLVIRGCTCTSLPDWFGDMTSLSQLEIFGCTELRTLPSSFQRLTNLYILCIYNCPELEKRCKRETGEDWQYIDHIPLVLGFPEKETFSESIRSAWKFSKFCTQLALNALQHGYTEGDEFDSMVDGRVMSTRTELLYATRAPFADSSSL